MLPAQHENNVVAYFAEFTILILNSEKDLSNLNIILVNSHCENTTIKEF